MNIPMPSPEERKKSCDLIIKKAFEPSFPRKLYDTTKALGFRHLWLGVEWCVLLQIVFSLIFLYTQVPQVMGELKIVPIELFFVAPLFYGSLLSLTLWKEMMDNVFPIKQTCYYSTAQLTSLRCLCFGGISVLIQVIAVMIVILFGGKVAVSSLLLSLSLLFFYGGISLMTLRKTENWVAHGFTLGAWCLIAFHFTGKIDLFSLLSTVGSGLLLFFLIPLTMFVGIQLKKYFLQGELSC